ncbi:MAG: VOC family protein [Saprospiraceae bacterium]|nr:VOC family protein [Saprospiraceae bacterium]
MSIKPKTPGIHHLTLRTSNYDRSKDFYTNKMGFEIILEKPSLFIFFAGGTAIAVRGPVESTPKEAFNPFTVGLDHVALGCEERNELERVAIALDSHDIQNTGIKVDDTLGKEYIAFKDPDMISWEFYMI